jgi:PAS domain S-box-containing protein
MAVFRVLYVDDEPQLLEIGKIFLERGGQFAVETISSATAALSLLNTSQYDAVVADYQMPEMDGIELLKKVRTSGNHVPFILFTGRGREEVVIQALNEGADFYLQKGGDPTPQYAELSHKIRQAIQKRLADIGRKQTEEEVRQKNLMLITLHELEREFAELPASERVETLAAKKLSALSGSAVTIFSLYDPALQVQTVAAMEFAPGLLESLPGGWEKVTRWLGTRPEDLRIPIRKEMYLDIRRSIVGVKKTVTEISYGYIPPLVSKSIQALSGIDRFIHIAHIIDGELYGTSVIGMRSDRPDPSIELLESFAHLVATSLRRQQAEEALRESESKFRAVVDQSIDGTIIVDFTGKLLFANNSVAQFTGYDLSVVGTLNVLDLVSPEFRLQAMSDFARVAAGTDSYPAEYKIIGAGNRELWIECIAKKISFAGTAAMILSIRDLSGRQRAEEAFRTREEVFRQITENLATVLYIHDRASNTFVFVSPAYEKVWMQSRQTLYDNPYSYLEAVHPDDLPRLKDAIRRELEEGVYLDEEYRIIRPDGSVRWIHSRNFPVIGGKGTAYRVAGTAEDVTDLKNSRSALEESEEKFRSFIEQALEGVSIVDVEGRINEWNTAQEKITGIPRAEALGTFAWDLATRMIPDRHRREEISSRMRDSIQASIKSGENTHPEPVFYRFLRPDGTIAVARQTVFVIKTSHGHMIGTLNQDVTEHQHTETMIKESEAKFRSLVEYALESISIIDFSGKGLFTNRATARLLEMDRDTPLAGRSVMEFLSPESQKDAIKDFTRVAEGEDAYLTQYTVRTAKGNTLDVECIGKVISYDGKPAILLSLRDITERKKAENALRSANRQLTLLTGITRHDILNKVSVILGFLKIAEQKTSDPAMGSYLKRIEGATAAIKSQIEFTRVYQDLGTVEPQWLALDSVMPRAQLPPAITLNADGKDIRVFADPMLEKVFSNLLDNSIRHGLRVNEIRVSSRREGEDLVVVWEDNGVGIPEDEKERIFERGFGKNTGLGMFLAREILSLTGITIRENGEPGKGARFEIVVPKGAYRVSGE